ncbi:hypothetical protein [Gordonia sp. (in: high G+C Gram-positive bacteria)]|nr:hypothetical protein [Gordonia sp. (in: high G+C Gram-positive bacteria)]
MAGIEEMGRSCASRTFSTGRLVKGDLRCPPVEISGPRDVDDMT